MPDVEGVRPIASQPHPDEFAHKRNIMERLMAAALQVCQSRRSLGASILTGAFPLEAADSVIIEARQSGTILVTLANPSPHLHLERPQLVWDEAMLSERMV